MPAAKGSARTPLGPKWHFKLQKMKKKGTFFFFIYSHSECSIAACTTDTVVDTHFLLFIDIGYFNIKRGVIRKVY